MKLTLFCLLVFSMASFAEPMPSSIEEHLKNLPPEQQEAFRKQIAEAAERYKRAQAERKEFDLPTEKKMRSQAKVCRASYGLELFSKAGKLVKGAIDQAKAIKQNTSEPLEELRSVCQSAASAISLANAIGAGIYQPFAKREKGDFDANHPFSRNISNGVQNRHKLAGVCERINSEKRAFNAQTLKEELLAELNIFKRNAVKNFGEAILSSGI